MADPDDQARHEQGKLQPRLADGFIRHEAEDDGDIDRHQRAHEADIVEAGQLARAVRDNDDRSGFIIPRFQLVALDQEFRDRPADQRRQDQAHRRRRNAHLDGIRYAVARGNLGCPGDRGTVPADQRGRTDQHRRGRRQSEQADARQRDHVLQDDEGQCQAEQNDQRATAAKKVGKAGVQSDRGEEDHQQRVTGREFELDLLPDQDIRQPHQQRGGDTTGDRLGNVEIAQGNRTCASATPRRSRRSCPALKAMKSGTMICCSSMVRLLSNPAI